MRTEFFSKKCLKKKQLEVDYLFTFGKFYARKYKQYVKSKIISLGSFKNNIINNEKEKRSINTFYIPQDLHLKKIWVSLENLE